jgi:glycosyltransferase involved in cell wall biosynthesis
MRDTFKDFDVIYVQNFPAQIWLYYAKQHAKYPFPKIIWICHEPPHQLYSELLEPHRKRQVPNRTQRSWIKEDIKAGSSYETAYCNSEFIANVFHKLYKRVPTVFHFGVNLDRWKNIPILALPKKPTIVIISRLVSPKNIETALRAIALATKKAPELLQTLKVKIGGKGPELENLQIAAKELNLSQIVDFCGFIPDNEIPAFFMQGSFTLFIPLDEPMGLIPIESGLFGRATLGADQGGVPEIIKNNETGILVNPQNIEAIANQIVRLCNDQELAVRLGENARKEVLNNFNFDDYIDKFEAKTLEYSLPRNDCK